MKLNRNQILCGLAGIILAAVGSFGMYKGISYDMLSEKYKITNPKVYESYQRKRAL